MKAICFSLNNPVRVQVTEYGAGILNAHHRWISMCELPAIKAGGYVDMPLRDVFKIFGEFFRFGREEGEPIFENDEIMIVYNGPVSAVSF